MTQAKRYQGEKLRAEQWYNMGRERAYARMDAGMPSLRNITLGYFDLKFMLRFDPVECGYLIVVDVYKIAESIIPGMRSYNPERLVLTHEEPALEFPSDHLKTKLLLIAG